MWKRLARCVHSFLHAFTQTKHTPSEDAARRKAAKNIQEALHADDWSGPGSQAMDSLIAKELSKGHEPNKP